MPQERGIQGDELLTLNILDSKVIDQECEDALQRSVPCNFGERHSMCTASDSIVCHPADIFVDGDADFAVYCLGVGPALVVEVVRNNVINMKFIFPLICAT